MIAAEGPKGLEVARRLGDGLFVALIPPQDFAWCVQLAFGTVLEEREQPTSDRVLEAAGPAAAVAFHATYEMGGRDAVAELPNGAAWLERIEAIPEAERHLTVHEGHLVELNEIDRELIPREMIAEATLTGSPPEVRAKLEAIAAGGITELAYQPHGPDIPRELEAFMSAARGA